MTDLRMAGFQAMTVRSDPQWVIGTMDAGKKQHACQLQRDGVSDATFYLQANEDGNSLTDDRVGRSLVKVCSKSILHLVENQRLLFGL
jgi:hypothetical protein